MTTIFLWCVRIVGALVAGAGAAAVVAACALLVFQTLAVKEVFYALIEGGVNVFLAFGIAASAWVMSFMAGLAAAGVVLFWKKIKEMFGEGYL